MTVNVVSFLFSWCWGPLCWVMAFFTASYQHLLWTPIHQGPKSLRPGVAFPITSRLQLPATQQASRTQLSYIIVRHPLDLWNRMFNRHQAEITVMQFRGHSFQVHQSMSVPWKFFSSSHFISQFPPTRFPLINAIGMCHFLPVHHLEWHFGPGRRSKYNTFLVAYRPEILKKSLNQKIPVILSITPASLSNLTR